MQEENKRFLDTSLFARLGRLFNSTDVIIRNIGGKNLKVVDVNQIQQSGKIATNSLVDRFTKLYVNRNSNTYNPALNYQILRQQLYADYEAMDLEAICTSTLDLLADECTLENEHGDILTIKTSNEKVKRSLENLYYDILNLEYTIWGWTRQMLKFGDFFLKLEIAEKFGVYNVIPYTVYHMARLEGLHQDNPSKIEYVLDPDGLMASMSPDTTARNTRNRIVLENYEVAHFRLLADANYYPYGRSYLEPARKVFKQYTLAKDAMLLHRIMRSPERRVYYINVGTIPANEVENYMRRQIDGIKKVPYVDPNTNEYNLRFNLQNSIEDMFIPVRGNDKQTRIETLPGLQYNGIEDVEYLRNELFAALKIPKGFLGYEEDVSGKSTLAAQDIRFARTVKRIQKVLEGELIKIGLIHLYAQGFSDDEIVDFDIKLSAGSILFEQERIELLKSKFELIQSIQETQLLSSDWLYEHILNMSEDEYEEQRNLVREDKGNIFRLTQIENEGNDPAETGKSYGTPHDLAVAYNARNQGQDLPAGYDKDITLSDTNPVGRPKDVSRYGKGDSNFGRNPIGKDGKDISVNYKPGPAQTRSPQLHEDRYNATLATYYKHKEDILKLFQKNKQTELSLLKEENEEVR